MRTRYNPYIFMLFVSLCALACEKTVTDFEIKKHPAQIVLNGILNPDTTIYVNLSRNMGIEENSVNLPFLENATVSFYVNNIFLDTLRYMGNGYYTLSYFPPVNKEYKVKAIAPGLNEVNAVTYLPSKGKFDKVETRVLPDLHSSNCIGCSPVDYFEIKVKPSVNGGEEQFFSLSVEANILNIDCMKSVCERKYNSQFDYTYDSCYCEVYDTLSSYASDIYFYTDEKVMDFYEVYDGVWLLTTSGTVQTNKAYFKGSGLHNAGGHFTLRIDEHWLSKTGDTFLKLKLRSMSREVYEFLNSMAKANETEMDPFAEKVTIFTNVQNGLGLFASYTECDTIIEWHLPAD